MNEVTEIIQRLNIEESDTNLLIQNLKKELNIDDDIELFSKLVSTILENKEEIDWIKENALYIPEKKSLDLPEKALKLWETYKAENPDRDIFMFIADVWQKYIDAGVMYQNDFNRLDPKGMQRLKNAIKTKNKNMKNQEAKCKVRDHMPTMYEKTSSEVSKIDDKKAKEISRLAVNLRRK